MNRRVFRNSLMTSNMDALLRNTFPVYQPEYTCCYSVGCVFVDFRKAFGLVDHKKDNQKFKHYKIINKVVHGSICI